MKYRMLFGLFVLAICLLITINSRLDTFAQSGLENSFNSPLPFESTTLSKEAVIARDFIAADSQIPAAMLQVVNQETLHFSTIDRTYELLTIIYSKEDIFREFEVLVDTATGAIEPSLAAVRQAEEEAQ